jgi:hypothetical protein
MLLSKMTPLPELFNWISLTRSSAVEFSVA